MARLEEREGKTYCIEDDGTEWEYTPAPEPPLSGPSVSDRVEQLEAGNEHLGQQFVEQELEVLAAQRERDMIGSQLVQRELEVLSRQEDNAILRQQVVDHDLRLLQLEGGAGA